MGNSYNTLVPDDQGFKVLQACQWTELGSEHEKSKDVDQSDWALNFRIANSPIFSGKLA